MRGGAFSVENAGRTGEEGGSVYAFFGVDYSGKERGVMSFISCLLNNLFVDEGFDNRKEYPSFKKSYKIGQTGATVV